ncbi:hypothetical protein RB196_00005 [Streptomyces sp. PmtA]|uniref:hypothetical protein n=1 Tax=Streptomyces sp. PmtA TaxID=3074275 RepID=UPI0030151BB1
MDRNRHRHRRRHRHGPLRRTRGHRGRRVAGTAADQILGSITEGLLKDSSDEVIYSNGQEIDGTRNSTYTLVETAAQKAGDNAKNPSPHIVSAAATAAEQGFNNAQTNLDSFIEGQGVPRQLDTKKD